MLYCTIEIGNFVYYSTDEGRIPWVLWCVFTIPVCVPGVAGIVPTPEQAGRAPRSEKISATPVPRLHIFSFLRIMQR
jgi:hypothetical protein